MDWGFGAFSDLAARVSEPHVADGVPLGVSVGVEDVTIRKFVVGLFLESFFL